MDDTSNYTGFLEYVTAAAKLKQALSSFLESLDAVTIPVAEGRKIPDGSGAIALSEKADDLYREILPFSLNSNGYQKVDTTTKGVSVKFAPIGRNGFDAEACAAFQRISLIVGFPAERWNRLQATNPGGNHHRYESCDVISSEDIELVKSALRLLENQQPAQEEEKKNDTDKNNKMSLDARAVAQLVEHPNWSNKDISKAIGCNEKSLYRCKKFRAAKKTIRQNGQAELPRGSKYENSPMESWEDESGNDS